MQFSTAIHSSTGGRSKNQDTADHFEEADFEGWVLADGLGGHRGGGLASSLATDAMIETARTRGQLSAETLRAAAQSAQETLQERQQRHPEYSRMRTTFVFLLASSEKATAVWAHEGDSRLYHFRKGEVASRTKDHSAVQALVDAGEIEPSEARTHSIRNQITRALGDSGAANPDVLDAPSSVRPGDAFLLCSDGFWEGVTEDTMLATLDDVSSPSEWIDEMADEIEESGGADQDNYTSVAVLVRGETP